MYLKKNGLFCVEFNTFVNEPNSLKVLRKWKSDCLECCTSVNDGIHFGDQKYLDSWPIDYPDVVHICQHPGAGIAPWNINWYEGRNIENQIVYYKKENREVPIVFYHYQHITYIKRHIIQTYIPQKLKTVDYRLVQYLYKNYLTKVEKKKKYLENEYGVDYMIKEHPIKESTERKKSWLKKFKFVVWIHKKLFPSRYQYCIYLSN